MKLMIVESPNKVAKIGGILGADWKVAASVGHIRDLPNKDIGVHAPAFKPEYVYTDRGESVTQRLTQLADRAEMVYLATDPDREGEAIAWHVKEALNLKNYQRVTFTAITPDVIFSALDKPRKIDNDLVKAQEARRVLDRLVGYQVSRPLSDIAGKPGLSAGRVQSPAVRIVVERERAILNFKETKHFGAEVSFDGGAWRAQWNTKPFLEGEDEYILDEQLALRAAACREFVVTSASRKTAYEAPKAPFTTSTMLQAASVTLGFNPDMTGKLAQELFAAGLITYHRTDSQNFADEALAEIRSFASGSGWPLPAKARKWKSKESAQEAHEAIRPTHLENRHAGASPQEQALYDLIWMRAVASQLADAEYSVTTLTLESGKDADTFMFVAKGRTLTAPGWKALTPTDAADEDSDESGEDDNKVPLLREESKKQADSGRVLNKATKAPPRYTEASLIKQLERIGVGRPSTYAAILKNIIAREYLKISKKYLVPTAIGYQVVDSLVGNFLFMEYGFTKNLEEELDNIAEGKADYVQVVTLANDQILKELAHVRATVPSASRSASANGAGSSGPADGIATCPVCKQGRIRQQKNDDPSKSFWGCTGFKKDKTGCNFSINGTVAKKTLTETVVKQLCEKRMTSSLIKGFTSKLGKSFEAHLKLDGEHRVVFEFPDRKA
jgi:DNA topoisomerase I